MRSATSHSSDSRRQIGSAPGRRRDTLEENTILTDWSFPGTVRENAVVDSLAESIDIYPTILELTGLTYPGAYPLAGRSLVPALKEGKPTGRKFAVSENWSQTTIIAERYKLGVWVDPRPSYMRDYRDFGDMCFARETDPLEMKNLAADPAHAAVVASLRGALDEWIKKVPGDGRRDCLKGINRKDISAEFGANPKWKGLVAIIRSAQIENVAVVRGARKGWQCVKHSRENKKTLYSVFARVEHDSFKNGRSPCVEIAVDYFDEGKGDFSIIYDSSDAAVKVVAKLPGACKEAGKFKLTDTNKWKTFVCRVNDAKFAGRGGADIRLDIASGDARPVIGAVGIRKINGC